MTTEERLRALIENWRVRAMEATGDAEMLKAFGPAGALGVEVAMKVCADELAALLDGDQ